MDKKTEHLKQRYEHHKSFRNLAEEFDMSKSQVHRIIKKDKESDAE